jgi:hypothetical protein
MCAVSPTVIHRSIDPSITASECGTHAPGAGAWRSLHIADCPLLLDCRSPPAGWLGGVVCGFLELTSAYDEPTVTIIHSSAVPRGFGRGLARDP